MPKKRPQAATQKDSRLAQRLRPVCLAIATALVVAAPLIPSERTELTGAALPQAMLWLLAALVWFAGVWLTRQPLLRFQSVDAVAFLFAAWIATSGVAMMNEGAPRPTLNAIWTWASLVTAFLLLRQLLRSEREVRALSAVMIGLAVCLSVIAMHQTFIAYPAMRELYQRDPEEALRQAGIVAPPGTVQRKQFEDRLNSTEPNATFSLTNSLAGYIAPWLVVMVAVAILRRRTPKNRNWPRGLEALATVAVVLLLAVCLLLTKSRSSWLATLLGLALVALFSVPLFQKRGALLAICGIAAVGLLVVMLAAAGILDVEILSQAGRSLAFRLEYWQATREMIGDYPLWGAGVGNFQEYYTAYKLPQASETIADPHNFALEIAATAGLPALVLFTALLGAVFAGAWRAGPDQEAASEALVNADQSSLWIFRGGAAGVVLALLLGLVTGYFPDVPPLIVGAAVGSFAVWLLRNWIAEGSLPRWVLAVAIGTLLVNLLAAGGISFPGVAITLWVLLASLSSLAGGQRPVPSPTTAGDSTLKKDRAGRSRPAIAALIIATLLFACYFTAYQPVLARSRLSQAVDVALADGDSDQAIACAAAAAAADPWSADPRRELAHWHFERWLAQGDARRAEDADFQAFEANVAAALARNARGYSPRVDFGYLYAEAYQQTRDPRLASSAMRLINRSVELYPRDALQRAQLAWLFAQAELPSDAAREAAEALRLDALCPHSERKLSQRRLFAEVTSGVQRERMEDDLRQLSAEQWMHRLRKN